MKSFILPPKKKNLRKNTTLSTSKGLLRESKNVYVGMSDDKCLFSWFYQSGHIERPKLIWKSAEKYAPPPKKMVKPKVKINGERRRGITKSLTERTTATEEPMTEASLSVKSSPSGGMKIYADLTWNSFFCVWTRGDAGLIMNANLMKYIGPLTFVELGFVGVF